MKDHRSTIDNMICRQESFSRSNCISIVELNKRLTEEVDSLQMRLKSASEEIQQMRSQLEAYIKNGMNTSSRQCCSNVAKNIDSVLMHIH